MTSDERVREHLDQLGVAYELVPCDPALADTAAFCQAYGYSLGESANTIVVVGKSQPPVFAACVVLADTRLDVNRAVKQRMGVRRVSFASADETAAVTGMMIGGVTVFGLPPQVPIWVDERVMAQPRIVLGGGSRSWKVVAAPGILHHLANVEIVPGLARPLDVEAADSHDPPPTPPDPPPTPT